MLKQVYLSTIDIAIRIIYRTFDNDNDIIL